MEIALLLAIIAAAAFAGQFFKDQPTPNLLAVGLVFFAAAVAVFFYVAYIK